MLLRGKLPKRRVVFLLCRTGELGVHLLMLTMGMNSTLSEARATFLSKRSRTSYFFSGGSGMPVASSEWRTSAYMKWPERNIDGGTLDARYGRRAWHHIRVLDLIKCRRGCVFFTAKLHRPCQRVFVTFYTTENRKQARASIWKNFCWPWRIYLGSHSNILIERDSKVVDPITFCSILSCPLCHPRLERAIWNWWMCIWDYSD